METRSQSRSKLLSTDDSVEKAGDPTTTTAPKPKSSLAARLEKREAMKRNSMDTNHGEQESDSSDDDEAAEEVNGATNGHGGSDDDGDELEGEVQDLKDEDMFARFTSEIVSGKAFPPGEFDSARPEDESMRPEERRSPVKRPVGKSVSLPYMPRAQSSYPAVR